VTDLASYIERRYPNLRGFTRRNLFRMRQFFETYTKDEIVSALLTQLPWTHHLLILSRCRRPEERQFYIRLAVQEKWSSRDLERQLAGALFERAVLNPPKVSTALRQLHPGAEAVFRDSYLVEGTVVQFSGLMCQLARLI
jgi:predicted nuclease of restriction endonuclease-like (RecB) superfamily